MGRRSLMSSVSVLVLFVLALASIGCRAADEPARANTSAPASSAAPASADGRVNLPRSSALVTTVNMTVAVASVIDATARVRDEAARTEGFVANMNASGEGRDRHASITARIPAPRLADFRKAVGAMGEVTDENEQVEDVGEERADRQARLVNARAEEKRLHELLAQKTGSLAEVLAVERELARVRENIERLDAQAAALDGKIAYATITVNVVQSAASKSGEAGSRIAQATSNGVRYAGVVMVGLVVGLFEVGPTLLILALIFGLGILGIRFIVRRTRDRGVGQAVRLTNRE